MPHHSDDLDLDLEPGRAAGPAVNDDEGRPMRPLIVAGTIVLLLAVAVGWWWSSRPTGEVASDGQAATDAPVEAGASPAARLGEGAPTDLPPLAEMDPAVRALVSSLSARPELATLLATDDLVRRFVVAIDRIGRGASPAGQVSVLRPSDTFSVERPNARTSIQPESYARYAGVVSMVLSLDPDDLARIYGQLRPRLDEAYAELGVPGETFDAAVQRAFAALLSVPVERAGGQVVPIKGTQYAWADPQVENLSQAQKHLLRLGPTQAAAVQAHLRRVAAALGIPADRLPAT